jgi:hypothetical protein
MRRTLVALALALPIATVPVAHGLDLRDNRLPRDEAEKLLTARLATPTRFSCEPMDEDASLAIPDADYFCQAGDVGYWIGTDEHRITQLQFAG